MQKGFFAALFDVSFRSLITPRVIKVLYILALIVIGIGTLIGLIAGLVALAGDPLTGLVTLILVPLFALLYVIYARIALEVVIALFHVMQNTSEMVRIAGGRPATSGVFVQPALPQGNMPTTSGGNPTEPGWYPDPQGQAQMRYFDGTNWTEHTA